MSQTSWISRQAYSLERQRAASSNASDLLDIEAGLQSWETASSQQQCLRPIGYRDKPTVLRDSEQPVAMPQTYWISRQAFSLERQRAVSSNASDLLDIEAGLQSSETASSQQQCLRPIWISRQAFSLERQRAASGNASGLLDIEAGLQSWETSEQSAAMSQTYWISRQAFSLERQRAASGNASDLLDIEAGPRRQKTERGQCEHIGKRQRAVSSNVQDHSMPNQNPWICLAYFVCLLSLRFPF